MHTPVSPSSFPSPATAPSLRSSSSASHASPRAIPLSPSSPSPCFLCCNLPSPTLFSFSFPALLPTDPCRALAPSVCHSCGRASLSRALASLPHPLNLAALSHRTGDALPLAGARLRRALAPVPSAPFSYPKTASGGAGRGASRDASCRCHECWVRCWGRCRFWPWCHQRLLQLGLGTSPLAAPSSCFSNMPYPGA